MRKSLPAILSFFSFLLLYLLLLSPVLAQTCPPLGTNIAANFDRKNLEFLAKKANCEGPIPITVIITPVLVEKPHLLIQVQKDLRELNFNPTWRPWGFVEPNSPELNDWLKAFSYLEIGQLQAWNEWNRYKEAGTLNPERDAQVIQALINARKAGLIKIPIGNTPLDLLNYTDINFRKYWDRFFTACPNCVNDLDFIVSNVYANVRFDPGNPKASISEFLKVWRWELDYLAGKGVNLGNKFFIISEAGLAPGVYPDFEQRLRDTLLFAQALEAEILKHPERFPNLDQITFLLMNDETGEQFLIYRVCDDQGNCNWEVTKFLEFNWNVPGGPFFFPEFTCNPALGGEPDSRPLPCDACILDPPLAYACATTFAVHDTVSWRWEDSNFVCDATGEHWVEREWGGNIIIDSSQVTVPFVGKKGEEDVQKYLADYFEGTAFYYGPDIDLNDCKKENPNEAERRACQKAVERVVMEGGVFRKLAPKELQDKLKKEMITRAKKSLAGTIQEGTEIIHDYLIEHAGLSMQLSQFQPPPELPVRVKAEEYQNWKAAYNSWKKTPSGKLWAAVPMFSREDSPGQVIASVNTKRKDTVAIIPPVQEEQVPHLARLFEVTRELRRLLMPWLKEEKVQAPERILLASSNPQVLGEKTLLAQAEPCKECLDISIANPMVNNGMVYATLVICHQCPGHGPVGDVSMGPCGVRGQVYSIPPGCFSSNHPAIIPPAPISCPGTASLCVEIRADRDVDPSCQGQDQSINCQVTVDADCNVTDTNCGGGLPPPPACGLAEPPPYPGCEYESITDDNPNDTICCDPIIIDLKAVEQFANPDYTGPCVWTVDPLTGERDLLNPNCKNVETRHVSRQVKVDLFHPYLDEIWEQTTDSFRGLFNIFRPEVEPHFEDLQAHSYVSYSYPGGSITPGEPWKFYFPRLGGIQKAKEWVLETLNPKEK